MTQPSQLVLPDSGNGVFDDNDSLNNDPYFGGFTGDYVDPATFAYPSIGAAHLDIPPVYSNQTGRGAQPFPPTYHNAGGMDHLESYVAPTGASNGRGVHIMSSTTPPPILMGDQFYTSNP